jgi:putative PIN family toxin of toxin-antitoxin system
VKRLQPRWNAQSQDPGEGPRAVVLDTNIALDLLLFADPAAAAVRALLGQRRLDWLATAPMRGELERVLGYAQLQPRMRLHGLDAPRILAAFDALARPVAIAPRAPWACKDADDQKFIDLAVAHRAILVSRDKAILCMRKRLLTQDIQTVSAIVFDGQPNLAEAP